MGDLARAFLRGTDRLGSRFPGVARGVGRLAQRLTCPATGATRAVGGLAGGVERILQTLGSSARAGERGFSFDTACGDSFAQGDAQIGLSLRF